MKRQLVVVLLAIASCKGNESPPSNATPKVAEPPAAPAPAPTPAPTPATAPTPAAAVDPKELASKWLQALAANDKAVLAELTSLPFTHVDGDELMDRKTVATNEAELQKLLTPLQGKALETKAINSGFGKYKDLTDIFVDPTLDANKGQIGDKTGMLAGFAVDDVNAIAATQRDHLVALSLPANDGAIVMVVAIRAGKVTHLFQPNMESVE